MYFGQIFLLFLPFCLAASEKQPDLKFQPFTTKYEGVIWYQLAKSETVQYWTNAIDDFLARYKRVKNPENIVACDRNNPPQKGRYCEFDLRSLGPCSAENYYGYLRGSPCIFLSLTEVAGWVPQYYNSTTLPSDAPQHLKDFAKNSDYRMVYISCEGGTAADIENLGAIEYYPTLGFPDYYFPYNNVDGYQSPIVAVHVKRPQLGVIINIICTAWAKNIARDKKENVGTVSIELLVDN